MSAAQRVFGVFELTEMIVLEMEPKAVLDRLHSDPWLIQVVQGSKNLQRKLFLLQESEVPIQVPDWAYTHEMSICEPNRILLPKARKLTHFRLDDSGIEYSIKFNVQKAVFRDQTGQSALYGDPSLLWQEKTWYSFEVHRYKCPPRHEPSPLLPKCWLATYLTDHKAPIKLRVRGDTKVANVWVPAGKTLGDLVHFVDAWSSGLLKRSDILNGIHEFDLIARKDEAVYFEDESDTEVWRLQPGGGWVAPGVVED